MIPGNIPEELRSAKRWLLWQLLQTERDKKPRKVPMSTFQSSCGATSHYAHAWETFDDALGAAQRLKVGIGYVFVEGDGIVGIDLDKCRNRATGEIAPWAQEIVDQFKGFTEISPSGTGIHIIAKGSIAKASRGTLPGGGAIEIYSDSRYFTVTGDILPGRNELHEEQAEIDRLMDRIKDGRTIERLFNGKSGEMAKRLWEGDLDPCEGDHSNADFKLLRLLRRATGGDKEATERLFGQSKLSERDKWKGLHASIRTGQARLPPKPVRPSWCERWIPAPTQEPPGCSSQ